VVLGAVAAFLGAAGPAGSAHAAIVSWTGLGDGVNWSNPANWSGGVLPGPGDDVAINVAGTPTIVIAGVSPTVRSLSTLEVLRIETGSVVRAATATCRASVQMAGGTIMGGQWAMTGQGNLLVQGASSTLDGVTVGGELPFSNANATLTFLNNSTVTRIRVRGQSCRALFHPGTVIGFPILLDQSGISLFTIGTTTAGTLTLGPTTTISGIWPSTLRLGQPSIGMHFINQGTISVSGSSRVFAPSGARFTNAAGGIVELSGGAILTPELPADVPGAFTNDGRITANTSTINMLGLWDNRGVIETTTASLNLGGLSRPTMFRASCGPVGS
jgi:hypothetical protein